MRPSVISGVGPLEEGVMARVRGGTIYMNTDVEVEIDIHEVLTEVDIDDLQIEMDRRKGVTVKGAFGPEGGQPVQISIGSWDGDTLREAIRTNDAYRVLDIMKDFVR